MKFDLLGMVGRIALWSIPTCAYIVAGLAVYVGFTLSLRSSIASLLSGLFWPFSLIWLALTRFTIGTLKLIDGHNQELKDAQRKEALDKVVGDL